MSITINTKVCHSWVFDDKEEEEAKVCEALSNLAIKTGISSNEVSHLFPIILRMMKSKSEWAK